jgi:hypothetical protein
VPTADVFLVFAAIEMTPDRRVHGVYGAGQLPNHGAFIVNSTANDNLVDAVVDLKHLLVLTDDTEHIYTIDGVSIHTPWRPCTGRVSVVLCGTSAYLPKLI